MKCLVCHGKGEFRCEVIHDEKYDEMVTCDECHGTGICKQKSTRTKRKTMADLKHVLALGKKLRSLFEKEWPQEMDIILSAPSGRGMGLNFHNVGDYQNGVEIMRLMGIQKWNKSVLRPEEPLTYLSADYFEGEDSIAIGIYCDGLPPTCRIETKMMKVPKEKTVETGDFIEIPVQKIVCGA